jgi:hypothetical protein
MRCDSDPLEAALPPCHHPSTGNHQHPIRAHVTRSMAAAGETTPQAMGNCLAEKQASWDEMVSCQVRLSLCPSRWEDGETWT